MRKYENHIQSNNHNDGIEAAVMLMKRLDVLSIQQLLEK